MIYACAARFDVTRNFEKFLVFWCKPSPTIRTALIVDVVNTYTRNKLADI